MNTENKWYFIYTTDEVEAWLKEQGDVGYYISDMYWRADVSEDLLILAKLKFGKLIEL